MKEGLKKRYRNYLNRFLDPKVPFKQKWVAFWRYSGMALGLVREKISGVDYAMIHQEDNSEVGCGNYTMSPTKVLKRIFADTENIQEKGFIDIGSGKGYAIKMASREGFRISGGVEYNKHLYDISISNLKKEQVSTDYVFCGKAQDFERYGDFDVFYFNNPFHADILSDVLKKILESHTGRKCWCYYVNPNNAQKEEAFLDAGFRLVKVIEDPAESYFTMNVYEN